jgi:hypothetical protein
MKRILKPTITEYRFIDYVSGSLDEFIKQLTKEFNAKVPEEFKNSARLNMTTRSEPYDSRDYPTIEVTWQRPETPEEENKRIAKEKYWEDQRRQTYENLKKEFGQ